MYFTGVPPREAWNALLAWYGPQTTGAKSDLSRCLNSSKVAPGSNLLEKMGRIEGLAAEMRTAGTLDDYMTYIFIDALPPNTRCRYGTWHLVTASAVMRLLRPFESGITDFLETGRRGPTLAMLAMLYTPAAAAAVVATGKVETAAKENAVSGDSTDDMVEAPTRTVVARTATAGGDSSSAKATERSTPTVTCYKCGRKGHWRSERTAICSRCDGRGHAADIFPTPKEGAVLAVSSEVGARDDDGDDGAVQASAFTAEEIGDCVGVSGRMEGAESAWHVRDKVWICDSGASIHTMLSADSMLIVGGSSRSIEGYDIFELCISVRKRSCTNAAN